MKVLQLGKLYYPETGGIEKTMQQIAEGIRESVDSYVLAAQPRGKAHREEVNGVHVYYAATFGRIASLPISVDLVRYLCRHASEFDVIHLHMPFPLGDVACLLSGFKGELVVYWHSDVVRQKKLMFFYRPIMERLLKRADVIVIATQGNIDGSPYVKPYEHKCICIPFGVTRSIEKRSDEFWRRRLMAEDKMGTLNLLFIGRLVYYKGCEVLIQALNSLADADIHLTIIGTGVLEMDLRQMVKGCGLDKQVHFLGYAEEGELIRQLEACDVFVFPSVAKSEAFGLVQLEAMAYGKPVINTSLETGVPYVSIHGVTGLTVKPGSERELADAIQFMKEHPEERIRMGDAARLRLKEEYTEEIMIDRLLKLYKELI